MNRVTFAWSAAFSVKVLKNNIYLIINKLLSTLSILEVAVNNDIMGQDNDL